MADLSTAFNIEDLRQLARQRLPRFIFDYLDGGADDERVLARNRAAFDGYALLTRVLVDVSEIDLRTRILGMPSATPFILSSTGASRFFHHEGELAAARAAAKANVLYGTAASAMCSIEEVAAVGAGPRFFQAYVFGDRGLNREFVQRCKAANYGALFLTVDCAVAGNRERDLRNRLSIPLKMTPSVVWQLSRHPVWLWRYLSSPAWRFPNVENALDEATKADFGSVAEWFGAQLDRSFTWRDEERLIKEWGGQFVLKGITRVEDALQAAAIGATGIVVSNHGGRQLDGLPSSLELLPPILDAVGDRLEVLVDGGFRRGTDILVALAMGARAVSLGRPYLYGLAAGGEAGVSRAIDLLSGELCRDLAMMGVPSLDGLGPDCLVRRRFLAEFDHPDAGIEKRAAASRRENPNRRLRMGDWR